MDPGDTRPIGKRDVDQVVYFVWYAGRGGSKSKHTVVRYNSAGRIAETVCVIPLKDIEAGLSWSADRARLAVETAAGMGWVKDETTHNLKNGDVVVRDPAVSLTPDGTSHAQALYNEASDPNLPRRWFRRASSNPVIAWAIALAAIFGVIGGLVSFFETIYSLWQSY